MRHATAEYARTPAAFKSEKRDCAVRALRVAADITYEKAHQTLGIYGRVPKRGTYNQTMGIVARLYGLRPVDSAAGRLPSSATGKTHPATLAQFVAQHREGRFVIRVNTHFLALVDGTVHDWAGKTGPRSRVMHAWGRP